MYFLEGEAKGKSKNTLLLIAYDSIKITTFYICYIGHLLTDICWLDICWLGLDICWLRHLLILATPAICWLWKDVCWFRHLLIQTIADSVITHISVFTTAVYHFNAQRGKFVHLYKLRNLPTFSKKLPQNSRILSKLKGNFQKTQRSSKSTTI